MTIRIKPSHEGMLHRRLGVAQGKPIPDADLRKASHAQSAVERKEAQFALNAKKWHHGK